MAYKLRREDGELLNAFELKAHHKEPCRAEIRDHEGVFPESIVIWYQVDGVWKILVAGQSAERWFSE